jgi:hypothetical protein
MSESHLNHMFTKRKLLPVVRGTAEIVSEGTRALEALPALIESLGDEASVSELQIWENFAITATVFNDLVHVSYGWNGERWVEVGFA